MSLWNKEIKPMLLEKKDIPFNDKDYIFEIKYDGIRSLIYISKNGVVVKGRHGADITDKFLEFKDLNKHIKGNVILDGEIIAFQDGKISFSKVMQRYNLKNKKTSEYLSKTNPSLFVCFDILFLNKDLTNLSLIKRKDILNKFKDTNNFVKSKYVHNKGIELFNIVKKMNMEGIVAKRKDSKYEINKRSNSWLKIKNYHLKEFIIIGYINKEKNLILLLGTPKNKKIIYSGKVSVSKKNSLVNEVLNLPILKITYPTKEDNAVYVEPKLKCLVGYLKSKESPLLRHPFIA